MTRQPIRIAVLNFAHETVTFLPNDTTYNDFIYQGSPARGEALLAWEPRSYMGGFVKVAREHEGVELVGIESPLWPKTGTGSGWITTEAYETFLGRMIAELKAGGKWDGVYLALHGAMGVRGVPKPEAEIARRVREVVGRGAFIVGTFDPHGNEDEEFLAAADMAFCVKYFPHYDAHLQGERAARMLIRAIRGDYTPATVTVKVPILTATVLQWTGASPWMDLVQRALTWEAREPDLYVNVFFGFPFADVPDVGLTDRGDEQRQARAGAQGRRRHRPVGVAPPPGAARHGQGPSGARGREARQGGGGARRLAGRAGRSQRPLGLGHLDPAAGDRAGPVGRADRHHRRSQGDRDGEGQGPEGGRSVRHGDRRSRRRVGRRAGARDRARSPAW